MLPVPSPAARSAAAFALAASSLLLASVAAGPAAAQEGGGAGDTIPSMAAAFPDASYVIEEMRTVYRFEADGTGTKTFGSRVHVLDDAGVAAFSGLVVPYVDAFQDVEVDFVRVRKPDGRTIEADSDQFRDRHEAGPVFSSVYTDARRLHVPVPSLRPGDVLEFRTVVTTRRPMIEDRFWIEDVYWDDGVVLEEVIEVNVPADEDVRVRGTPEAEYESRREGDRRVHRWTHSLREADPEDPEETGRRLLEAMQGNPDILVSSFGSWDEIAGWVGDRVRERREPTPEIRERVRELTAGMTTDRAKVEALYRFVSEEIRYVALVLGQGRYRPHPAADVLRNGYGDCKDKHTLLAAMLQVEGIESRPVLIHSQRRELLDVPSPSQFDHMITMVPLAGDTLWLDATSGVAPFDFLPWNLRRKRALVASREAGTLLRTPSESRIADVETIALTGRLTGTGRLAGRVVLEERGTPAMTLRGAFRQVPRSAREQAVEKIMGSLGLPGTVEGGSAEGLGAPDRPFVLGARVSAPDFLAPEEDSFTLPLADPTLSSLPEAAGSDSVHLGTPMRMRRVLAVRIPPDAEADLPLGVELERPYAAFRSSYSLEGDTLRAERILDVRTDRIATAEREGYAAFRSAVEADAAQEVAIRLASEGRERTVREAGAEEVRPLHDRAYELLRAGEVDPAEPILERVVELAPDHGEAWNNLGRVYLEQGRLQEAEEAFRRQIEIDPYHDHAHNNLGLALWRAERPEAAEAAFRRQIEVVPLHEYAHGNLGGLLADRGRLEEASRHLERAVKLQPSRASVRRRYGMVLLQQDRHREAAKVLREVDPGLAEQIASAESGQGTTLVTRTGDVGELVEATLRSLRNRDLGPTPELVARFLRQVVTAGDVRGRLDSLVREEPDNAAYRNAFASLLLYRGELEEGREHGLEATQLEPDEPFYWVTLGRLQYLNNDRTFALSAYRRARELDEGALEASPKDLEIYRELEGN